MEYKFDFLSFKDEKKIKKIYEKEKNKGNIDNSIIFIIDKLNSIDGFATIYSCGGHKPNSKSYLVLKFNEKMSQKIVFVIKSVLLEMPDIRVDWKHDVNYYIGDYKKETTATVLRGGLNCEYMEIFFNKLIK